MKKPTLPILLALGAAFLIGCSGSEGIRISSDFPTEEQSLIVEATKRWSESINYHIPIYIVDRRPNVLPLKDAPKKVRNAVTWQRGVTVDRKKVYLRIGSSEFLTAAMHEIGHLLGVSHIPDDPLMDDGGGLEPTISQNAISRVSQIP